MSDGENEDDRISVERADHRSPSVAALLASLDGELTRRYGRVRGAEMLALELAGPGSAFFVARSGGREVGCGGLCSLEPGIGDVRRLYAVRGPRGTAAARAILAEIEAEARRLGYRALRIETGNGRPESPAFYEGEGFRLVPCEGQATDPSRLCFEKRLDSPP